jgi:hypothetical protein
MWLFFQIYKLIVFIVCSNRYALSMLHLLPIHRGTEHHMALKGLESNGEGTAVCHGEHP